MSRCAKSQADLTPGAASQHQKTLPLDGPGCPGAKDMERPPLAPATNRPAVETHLVTEEAKPARSGSPLANTLQGFDGAAARPAAERVCCARAPRPPPEDEGAPRPPAAPAEQEDGEDDDDAELALLREQLKATERALARRKREEAAATPFLAAVFEDATFSPPATPTSPPGLVAPEAARPQVQAAAAARDRLEQTRKPRRQRLSAKKQRERPVRVVVVDDEPAGCLLPSCFEETMADSEQVEVEVARAPVEGKNKLVVKVHRARRLFGGGYGIEAVGAPPPYVRAVYGEQTRETACRRRTTSPCWQEELTFEARGATTVKLRFYSRDTYVADSLLGGCVLDLGTRPEFSLGAPRPLVEKSWFSVEPERRPTGPGDFLYRHRTALGSVEVSAYAYRAP